MLTVDRALQLVLQRAAKLPHVALPLADALGCVLAEDIASDIDSPPHDKSIVDGYALVAADLHKGDAELMVVEEIVAGDVPQCAVSPGKAIRVMTGAPIPAGADAVVMIEKTEAQSDATGKRVTIRGAKVAAGQNIVRQGAAMRRGDVALPAGAVLQPAQIGLLAECGCRQASVIGRPAVAVLSTGNELVPAEQIPGPGQIRNSNGPMLLAMISQAGGSGVDLGVGRDDRAELERLIQRGLESDVLLISGGVSAGVMDLVPGVLESLGVEPVFHKLRLKPGKPLWFGVQRSTSNRREALVFGLPGNPVSTFVCFELFVRPAMCRMQGREMPVRSVSAELKSTFNQRGDRPTYHPSRLLRSEDRWQVEPLRWQGSADLRGLAAANALAIFPAGDFAFAAGETIEVLRLD